MMAPEANCRTGGICREVEPINVTIHFSALIGLDLFPNPRAQMDLTCVSGSL
jgi:hypothetical protein